MLTAALLLSLLSIASADDEYQAVVEEAVAEFQAGRFVEARALFKKAHELQPSARTSRGIGMASFELSDYADALAHLSAALVDQRRPLTPEHRAQLEELIRKARAFTGRFRIDVDPSDAALTLDGRPIDRELTLDPGTYELAASKPEHGPVTRTLEVKGGEEETIRLELPRIVAEIPAPPPTGEGSALPILLLATGGAFAVGAAGSAVWWAGREEQLDRCDDAGANCFNRGALKSQRTLALGVTVGTAVAALATATAGAILIAATPTPDGAAISVGGSF
jgi:tetratricopeptide (TPR) repeat protein